MDKNEVMSVTQLPIIQEKLAVVKAEVSEKVNIALSLACTEETVKEIKKVRAALNSELKGWEERRKEVKEAIMMPYNNFEKAYKECISDVYKGADKELKEKVDAVEDSVKSEKAKEVREYFEELCAAADIDFVKFEDANINITLSASMKSLKAQAKSFMDRICADLKFIGTQEYNDEILYEYKQSLNVLSSVTKVVERHKALEAEKAREAERAERETERTAAAEKVDDVLASDAFLRPVEKPLAEEEKKYSVTFEVVDTIAKIKALKEFMEKEGISYEQL